MYIFDSCGFLIRNCFRLRCCCCCFSSFYSLPFHMYTELMENTINSHANSCTLARKKPADLTKHCDGNRQKKNYDVDSVAHGGLVDYTVEKISNAIANRTERINLIKDYITPHSHSQFLTGSQHMCLTYTCFCLFLSLLLLVK